MCQQFPALTTSIEENSNIWHGGVNVITTVYSHDPPDFRSSTWCHFLKTTTNKKSEDSRLISFAPSSQHKLTMTMPTLPAIAIPTHPPFGSCSFIWKCSSYHPLLRANEINRVFVSQYWNGWKGFANEILHISTRKPQRFLDGLPLLICQIKLATGRLRLLLMRTTTAQLRLGML